MRLLTSKKFLVVVEQDSHWVKAGLLQLNPTLPSWYKCMYDRIWCKSCWVPLYSCCFIYVFAAETSVLLVVPLGLRQVACTSATILHPWEGLVDSQASQPFSFVVVCTQTCNASACCLYALNDGSCDPCLYLMLCGSSEPLSIWVALCCDAMLYNTYLHVMRMCDVYCYVWDLTI